MTTLSIDDLLRLRHTSRIFMRIFSENNAFKKYHLTIEHDRERYLNTMRIWATPIASFYNQAISFYGGNLCSRCSEVRRGDVLGLGILQNMPFLYCARCNKKHREIHFSLLQRKETDDSERICVGHEGRLYICDHWALSFHQLQAIARQSTGEATILSCSDSQHGLGRPECQHQLCQYDNNPTAKVYRHPDQRLRLELSVSAHISITRLPSGTISAHHLRMELETMRSETWQCDWLPIEAFDAADVMRAFDPNICSCLEWGTSGPETRHLALPLCKDPYKEWRETCPPNGYTSLRGRCAGFRHGFDLHYFEKHVKVDVMSCRDRDDLLVVKQTICCVVDHASSVGWHKFLVLDKRPMIAGNELRGLTWCDQDECGVAKQVTHDRSLRVREAMKAAQHQNQ